MSDVGLAKVCGRHKIPRPGVGYWAKCRHGKKVKRTPLPKAPDRLAGRKIVLQPSHPGRNQRDPDGPLEEQRRFEREHRITVPASFEEYSAEVRRTRARFRMTKKNDRGLKRPTDPGCMALAVSNAQGERSFLILETLVRTFKERNLPLSVKSEGDGRVYVKVLGEEVHFSLEEESNPVEPLEPRRERGRHWLLYSPGEWKPPPPPKYQPTGRLSLRIEEDFLEGRKNWNDGEKRKVET